MNWTKKLNELGCERGWVVVMDDKEWIAHSHPLYSWIFNTVHGNEAFRRSSSAYFKPDMILKRVLPESLASETKFLKDYRELNHVVERGFVIVWHKDVDADPTDNRLDEAI